MTRQRRTWIGLAIIAVLAFLIVASPNGSAAKTLISDTISVAFLTSLAYAATQLYRERREWLQSLGDRDLGLVYGSISVALLTIVAHDRFASLGGPGTVLMILLLAACAGVVYWVWRESRRWTI